MTTVDGDRSVSSSSSSPVLSPISTAAQVHQGKSSPSCFTDAANFTDTEVDYCPEGRGRSSRAWTSVTAAAPSDRFFLRRPNLYRYSSWHERFHDNDFQHLHHPHHHPYATGFSPLSLRPRNSFPLYRGYMGHRTLLSSGSTLPSSGSQDSRRPCSCSRCTFILAVILVLLVGIALLATFVYFTVAPDHTEYNTSSVIKEIEIIKEPAEKENVEAELRSFTSQDENFNLIDGPLTFDGDGGNSTPKSTTEIPQFTTTEQQTTEQQTTTEFEETTSEEESTVQQHSDMCQALETQPCYRFLPYTATVRPNMITGSHQQRQPNKAYLLEKMLVDTSVMFHSCYQKAEALMCMMINPMCDAFGVKQVCRSHCQDFVNSCGNLLRELDAAPDCDLLPEGGFGEECMDISYSFAEDVNATVEDSDKIPGMMETLHLMLMDTGHLLKSVKVESEFVTEDGMHIYGATQLEESKPVTDDGGVTNDVEITPETLLESSVEDLETVDPWKIEFKRIKESSTPELNIYSMTPITDETSAYPSTVKTFSGQYAGVSNLNKDVENESSTFASTTEYLTEPEVQSEAQYVDTTESSTQKETTEELEVSSSKIEEKVESTTSTSSTTTKNRLQTSSGSILPRPRPRPRPRPNNGRVIFPSRKRIRIRPKSPKPNIKNIRIKQRRPFRIRKRPPTAIPAVLIPSPVQGRTPIDNERRTSSSQSEESPFSVQVGHKIHFAEEGDLEQADESIAINRPFIPNYTVRVKTPPKGQKGRFPFEKPGLNGNSKEAEENVKLSVRSSCKPMYLRICKSVLGYELTSYPNIFLHKGNSDLRNLRRTFRRNVRELKKCHKDAVTLVCSMLQPKCSPEDRLQSNICPNLCNEIKSACSRTLREMFLYPNCDKITPTESCLTLEDITSEEKVFKRPSKVVVREKNTFAERIDSIHKASDEYKDSDKKDEEQVTISVIIPYKKIKRNHSKAAKVPSDKNMESEKFSKQESREGNIELQEDHSIDPEMMRIRKKGPTRKPKEDKPIFGSIVPPTVKFTSEDFITKFPFPKIQRPKGDKRKDTFVIESSRSVKYVHPQEVRQRKSKITPLRSPVFMDSGPAASVGYGARIQSHKNYEEIEARAGIPVKIKPGPRKGDGYVRDVKRGHLVSGISDSISKLTSYAARTVDLNPIRAALLRNSLTINHQEPKNVLTYVPLKPISELKPKTTQGTTKPTTKPTTTSSTITTTEIPTTQEFTEAFSSEEDELKEVSEFDGDDLILPRFNDSLEDEEADNFTADSDMLENNCTNSSFMCSSGRCIEPKRVCDDVNDCDDGEDEKSCVSLSPVPEYNGNTSSLTEGYLLFRVENKWYPVCSDLWEHSFDAKFCKKLHFRYGGSSSFKSANLTAKYVYYHDVFGSAVPSKVCHNNEIVHLQCTAHMACLSLLTKHHPERICDGIPDCRDFADEINCHPCDYKTQFLCMKSKTCIDRKNVCDGKADCQNGEDESNCLLLSRTGQMTGEFTQVPTPVESSGFLMVRKNNHWHLVCSDSWIPNLSRTVCNRLSYKNLKVFESRRTYNNMPNAALTKFNNRVSVRFVTSPLYTRFEPDSNESNCSVVYISCDQLACSELPQSIEQRDLEIWPWFAALNADGFFRCPAVIIDGSWAVASSDCVKKLEYEYMVIRAGTGRLQHYNPYEQVAQINYIAALNSSISNIAILHFYKPILFSGSTWPICMASWEDPSELKDCVIASWDHGSNFESDFRNERAWLTDIGDCNTTENYTSSSNICVRREIKKGTELKDCRGNDKSILMCKLATRWTFVGIELSDATDCRREYTLFSDVQNHTNWIDSVKERIKKEGISFAENRIKRCPEDGFMCLHGNCIKNEQVCDGVIDCLDESDEISCQIST